MRALSVVPNIEGATTDFPNGRIRDEAGAVIGTSLVEALSGDTVQFFQKLIIDAGITPNGQPDNVTQGYQLIDALVDKIKKTGVQRSMTNTMLTTSVTGSETDFLTITPSATEAFDDIKINVSLSAAYSGVTVSTITTKVYVDGVLKHTVGLSGNNVSDKAISFCISGIPYVANKVVKVTLVGAVATGTVSNGSLIVEGLNN
jgi:hypothetical protein